MKAETDQRCPTGCKQTWKIVFIENGTKCKCNECGRTFERTYKSPRK